MKHIPDMAFRGNVTAVQSRELLVTVLIATSYPPGLVVVKVCFSSEIASICDDVYRCRKENNLEK